MRIVVMSWPFYFSVVLFCSSPIRFHTVRDISWLQHSSALFSQFPCMYESIPTTCVIYDSLADVCASIQIERNREKVEKIHSKWNRMGYNGMGVVAVTVAGNWSVIDCLNKTLLNHNPIYALYAVLIVLLFLCMCIRI